MSINTVNNFLRLSRDPFSATPDPDFFYATLSHEQALSSIRSGIETRSGLISLTGDVGTGKTALIHVLLNRIDQIAKTVCIYYPSITVEELLTIILKGLDVPVEEKSRESLWGQLEECSPR